MGNKVDIVTPNEMRIIGDSPIALVQKHFGEEISKEFGNFCLESASNNLGRFLKTNSFLIEYGDEKEVVEKLSSLGVNFERELPAYDIEVSKQKIPNLEGISFSVIEGNRLALSLDDKSVENILKVKTINKRVNLNELCFGNANCIYMKTDELPIKPLRFVNIEKFKKAKIDLNFDSNTIYNDPLANIVRILGNLGYLREKDELASHRNKFHSGIDIVGDNNTVFIDDLCNSVVNDKIFAIKTITVNMGDLIVGVCDHSLSKKIKENIRDMDSSLKYAFEESKEKELEYPTLVNGVTIKFNVFLNQISFVFEPEACKEIVKLNSDIIKCYSLMK